MNDVQEALEGLIAKGWTVAAIADELEMDRAAVSQWRHGHTYPANHRKMVMMALGELAQRKLIPKGKRYTAPRKRRAKTVC